MIANYLLMGISYGMSLLLFVSFAAKAFTFSEFQAAVLRFEIVKGRIAGVVAYAVLVAEIILATAMALLIALPYVFAVNLCMMAVFTWALWRASRKQAALDCHCFGASRKPTSLSHALIRNSILIALSGASIWLSLISTPLQAGSLNTLCALVAAALVYLTMKELTHTTLPLKNKA
ncbi:hypothetical protein EBB07_26175 [Paenibacillaceae bacterium]|nr:hypothetical protein EBB07_26175 [Paenibacillaceae bacterium]